MFVEFVLQFFESGLLRVFEEKRGHSSPENYRFNRCSPQLNVEPIQLVIYELRRITRPRLVIRKIFDIQPILGVE